MYIQWYKVPIANEPSVMCKYSIYMYMYMPQLKTTILSVHAYVYTYMYMYMNSMYVY